MSNIKYINATALQENVRQSNDPPLMKLYADSLLEAAPAVDFPILRRGMWITHVEKIPVAGREYGLYEVIHCSECQMKPTSNSRTTFCDHCGSRMDIFSLDELDAYHASLSVSAYNQE